ncbi:hypothetical protein WJX74_004014 [Apatococcus lobatus]|uniref:RNase III domain-containing protein n=1 Tax=Apatococcus lobatus TaxID=904363 RepID=A0AAW1RS35_9CHLO
MSPCKNYSGPRLHTGTVRSLLPRFRERRKQARLLNILAAAASVSQETTTSKPASGKRKGDNLTNYIKEEADKVQPDSPWANPETIAVEGLKEGQLLFRFGDTEGWEGVAEPLGSVSYGQAWQCRRKSAIIADHPDKAADISFSFPLWHASDAAVPSPEAAKDAQQQLEAVEASLGMRTTSSISKDGSSISSTDSSSTGSSSSTSSHPSSSPSGTKGSKLTKAEKRAKLAAERLEQQAKAKAEAKVKAEAKAKAKAEAKAKASASSSDSNATELSACTTPAVADDLQATLKQAMGISANGAAEPSQNSAGASGMDPEEAGLTKKERQRRRKALANAAKSPPEPADAAAASTPTLAAEGSDGDSDTEHDFDDNPGFEMMGFYFADTDRTSPMTPDVSDPTSPIVVDDSEVAASTSEPAVYAPESPGASLSRDAPADGQDAALSSTARDATAEASTSGRDSSKDGSMEDSRAAATALKVVETVSADAYLESLQASVPPSGQLVYQNGWMTRIDDSSASGGLVARPVPSGRSKGFGNPKDLPKAASKELPKHLQELPRQAKIPGPSSANGSSASGNGAAIAAGESRRADASRLEADPAISLAQIKQLAAAPVEAQAGLLQQAVAAAVISDVPQRLAKRGPLWRLRRRFRRAWKTMIFPVTWILEAAWLKARYRTLRALYTLLQPGPPAFHASPGIAQLLATAKTAGPEAAVQMSKDLGWDEEGKHEDPLSDLPRWRLEALIGGPVRNMSLFRQALTAPNALPEGQELASYERLEFLGDAVLELAIREYLFTRFDMEDEGQLTLISQMYLTNNASLCSIARRMHLDRYMATSLKRHLRTTWTDDTVLPDLLEALIGALYRDQGLAACHRFVRQQIINTTKLDPEVQPPLSRKSALISFVNTRSMGHIAFKTKPTRKVLSNGMNISTWVTEVRLNGRFLARADGNRKVCESLAAKAALLQLQSEEDDSQADEAK